ncbi:hypothetical protein TD95_005014 [Thielaviopsis punctulata]|uniref:Uncharacterized protein n=1 Tax=Thielaviopsis punctulata TaxID=72032 RepID=A0A0F4ZBL0_9PEZI|nr:hypothetical protein TD95_005014 [Thielaviopsis punctulata]
MSGVPSPDGISPAQFAETLARYEPFVEALSASKPLKPDQKPLAALDRFRYVHAPQHFSLEGPEKKAMQLDHVKALVEWKLRHGKFRPSLMGLVSSNPTTLVSQTIQAALSAYSSSSASSPSTTAALDILKTLRGIGPATASLLLSVHDPDHVLFFSDEAYYWLCGGGKKAALKYTQLEYEALEKAAGKVVYRLGVSALDVERVAYVLMRDGGEATKESVSKTQNRLDATSRKRKELIEDAEKPTLRRSKRGKPRP